MSRSPHRVAVVFTGGTISMRMDPVAGGNVPSLGGADILDPGSSGDTVTYANSAAAVTVFLNASTGNAGGDAQDDHLHGFANLIGSAHGDALTGDAAANRIDGGDGDDTVAGGLGNDTLVGGVGADTLSYAAAAGPVVVALAIDAGTPGAASGEGSDEIDYSIENLVGSGFADTLSGNDKDNIIDGGGGVDTASWATVSAALAVSLRTGLASGQGNDVLVNVENLHGGSGDDVLEGNGVANAFTGGGGNVAPTANFTFTTSGLTATFTDGSSDSDGTIASRSWNFGDGTTSTATNPSKTYSAAGTYSVQLTVTDNGGLTNSTTRSVTVSSTGGNVLTNGVPVTGLSGATNAELRYTMNVPAGSSNLRFAISGGTGDADLYVRFGTAPTTTTYDCRPYLSGNAETCNIATAQAGTYHVMVRGFSAFSGVSLTGSYSIAGPFFQNLTDFAISDFTTINSPITVTGVAGNAPATLRVAVRILHTYQGDLRVDLVAPDGSIYNLHNRTGAGTDNIITTYTVNASSEVANGTWNLRVAGAL